MIAAGTCGWSSTHRVATALMDTPCFCAIRCSACMKEEGMYEDMLCVCPKHILAETQAPGIQTRSRCPAYVRPHAPASAPPPPHTLRPVARPASRSSRPSP